MGFQESEHLSHVSQTPIHSSDSGRCPRCRKTRHHVDHTDPATEFRPCHRVTSRARHHPTRHRLMTCLPSHSSKFSFYPHTSSRELRFKTPILGIDSGHPLRRPWLWRPCAGLRNRPWGRGRPGLEYEYQIYVEFQFVITCLGLTSQDVQNIDIVFGSVIRLKS